MGVVPVFHGSVSSDGQLTLAASEQAQRQGYLRSLAGKPVDVVVKAHRNRRTDPQNRWWWGIAVPLLAQELGYDQHEREDLHYALVSKCFGVTLDPKLHQEIPKVRSSALTTAQFSALMEWVVRWAAMEYGVRLPLPNEAEDGLR